MTFTVRCDTWEGTTINTLRSPTIHGQRHPKLVAPFPGKVVWFLDTKIIGVDYRIIFRKVLYLPAFTRASGICSCKSAGYWKHQDFWTGPSGPSGPSCNILSHGSCRTGTCGFAVSPAAQVILLQAWAMDYKQSGWGPWIFREKHIYIS